MDIQVGQTWRKRNGDRAVVIEHDVADETYPWCLSDGEWVTDRGTDLPTFIESTFDLVELISGPGFVAKAADGWITWTGGEQPADTVGKFVTARTRHGTDVTGTADEFCWKHEVYPADIVAYKILAEENITLPVQMLDLPHDEAYISLADVLKRAYEQAASGKGKERHGSGNTPFEEQPMATINRQLGSIDGFIYQAHKKSLEAKRLPDGRAQAELLGAINYLAGAVIALDTWAKQEGGA